MERRHEEDVRKLWIRIALLTAAFCAITQGEDALVLLSGLLF